MIFQSKESVCMLVLEQGVVDEGVIGLSGFFLRWESEKTLLDKKKPSY